MPTRFGDLQRSSAPMVDDGIHEATITNAELVCDDHGSPVLNAYGKSEVRITFTLDERDESGDQIEIRSKMSTSLGQNRQTSQWSRLAMLIKAALGTPYGYQDDVTAEQLIGKRLRVQTEINDKGYCNVVGTFALGKAASRPAARPAPAPAPADAVDEGDEISF